MSVSQLPLKSQESTVTPRLFSGISSSPLIVATRLAAIYTMAEAIGVASGLLALASFAFKSSVTLYQTVESFKSHQQRVRDLVDELNALGGVLNSLTETVNSISDVDFSALKIPLLRCGNACLEFKGEILKFSSRSRGERTSFRDWAKLKYMGEDLDGFRRLLAGYKMTINVALTDATL